MADRANTPAPKQTQQDRADDKRWDPVSLRADWTNGSLDFALPGSIFHQAGLGARLPRTKGDRRQACTHAANSAAFTASHVQASGGRASPA